MKKLIILLLILFPLNTVARSFDTLNIKVIENGKQIYCLGKYIACYLPKYNLIVFDNNLITYPSQKIRQIIIHELCHHLTWEDGFTEEILEMKANVCVYRFNSLNK